MVDGTHHHGSTTMIITTEAKDPNDYTGKARLDRVVQMVQVRAVEQMISWAEWEHLKSEDVAAFVEPVICMIKIMVDGKNHIDGGTVRGIDPQLSREWKTLRGEWDSLIATKWTVGKVVDFEDAVLLLKQVVDLLIALKNDVNKAHNERTSETN